MPVRRDDLQFQRVGHVAARSLNLGFDFLDPALHVEVAFRYVVVLAFEDLLEAPHRFGHRNLFALSPGEHLRHAERLAQEALNLARAETVSLVLRRKLVHAENRDDVLQVFERCSTFCTPRATS